MPARTIRVLIAGFAAAVTALATGCVASESSRYDDQFTSIRSQETATPAVALAFGLEHKKHDPAAVGTLSGK